MTEHTELPWRSVRNTGVRNDGGYVVFSKAKPSHYPGQDERYEKEIAEWHGNLEYIALACNSHKDLLAACEELIKANRDARELSLRQDEASRGMVWGGMRQVMDAVKLKAEIAIKKAKP